VDAGGWLAAAYERERRKGRSQHQFRVTKWSSLALKVKMLWVKKIYWA
jgi:hypothetical protein